MSIVGELEGIGVFVGYDIAHIIFPVVEDIAVIMPLLITYKAKCYLGVVRQRLADVLVVVFHAVESECFGLRSAVPATRVKLNHQTIALNADVGIQVAACQHVGNHLLVGYNLVLLVNPVVEPVVYGVKHLYLDVISQAVARVDICRALLYPFAVLAADRTDVELNSLCRCRIFNGKVELLHRLFDIDADNGVALELEIIGIAVSAVSPMVESDRRARLNKSQSTFVIARDSGIRQLVAVEHHILQVIALVAVDSATDYFERVLILCSTVPVIGTNLIPAGSSFVSRHIVATAGEHLTYL